jgi:hypothetical protein
MFVPCLLVACAGSQAAAPRPASTAVHARPKIAEQAKTGVERVAPASTPGAAPGEDLDEYHLRMLALAQTQFETFIRKAGNEPRFAEAVRRSRDHIDDIEKTREFVGAGLAERRARDGSVRP